MRSLVFVVLGVVLLAGLFVWLRPQDVPPSAKAVVARARASLPRVSSELPALGPATMPGSGGGPATQTFDLVVSGGRLTSGPSTITVAKGDLVVLRIDTDREDELHVHGYDLSLKLHRGQTGSLAFQADRTGRFDVELHHGGGEIAALEVQPR
jgi:hypothetical protein